jgi:hypothetical protein
MALATWYQNLRKNITNLYAGAWTWFSSFRFKVGIYKKTTIDYIYFYKLPKENKFTNDEIKISFHA